MKIVTPARVCLFGDHQDYLGLPIIACAINRYMTLEAIPNTKGYFDIQLPDIGANRIIQFEDDKHVTIAPSDFFLSAMRVVKRLGCKPFSGFTIRITSTIPINAGVSSSSAMVISWVHFLVKVFGHSAEPKAELIAKLAYEAEVLEHSSPGGKMDQYSIALGNTIYLETGTNLYYELFNKSIDSMILVESGISKETLGTLSHVRSQTQEAVRLAKEVQPKFQLYEATESETIELAKKLPEKLQAYLLAAVKNHHITQKALIHLRKPKWDAQTLGELMYAHHLVLSDLLDVSHPKIDTFIASAMNAGAYGGKIVGSGGGGCAVILCDNEKKDAIIQGILKTGAKAAYEINISKGTHVEY